MLKSGEKPLWLTNAHPNYFLWKRFFEAVSKNSYAFSLYIPDGDEDLSSVHISKNARRKTSRKTRQ
jgi:hypothetical protein